MKKLLPLVLVLMIILSACGDRGGEVVASFPDLAALKKVDTEVRQPTLEVLSPDYIALIDEWLIAAGIESLYTCKYAESDSGTHMMYLFTPSRGLNLDMYTPINNDEITQIVWRIDADTADDNAIEAFHKIIKATVHALDYDNAETILAELKYESDSENAKTTCNYNNAGYVYSVENNIRQIFIMATGNR